MSDCGLVCTVSQRGFVSLTSIAKQFESMQVLQLSKPDVLQLNYQKEIVNIYLHVYILDYIVKYHTGKNRCIIVNNGLRQ